VSGKTWRNIAGFYWRTDFVHTNGVRIFAEISTELAADEGAAENIFEMVTSRKLPDSVREFKDSCSYDLEVGGQHFDVRCFKNVSEQNILISCGLRVRPSNIKSPA